MQNNTENSVEDLAAAIVVALKNATSMTIDALKTDDDVKLDVLQEYIEKCITNHMPDTYDMNNTMDRVQTATKELKVQLEKMLQMLPTAEKCNDVSHVALSIDKNDIIKSLRDLHATDLVKNWYWTPDHDFMVVIRYENLSEYLNYIHTIGFSLDCGIRFTEFLTDVIIIELSAIINPTRLHDAFPEERTS